MNIRQILPFGIALALIASNASAAPRVGEAIGKEHTTAVLGTHLPALLDFGLKLAAGLGSLQDPRARMVADPASRKMMLGGVDPLTEAGLREMGLDPKGEAALVFDSRFGRPGLNVVALLPVADRGKFLGFLESRAGRKAVSTKIGGAEHVELGGDGVLIGKRGAYTAVMPFNKAYGEKEVPPAFEAFLKGGGATLGASPDFKRALTDAPAVAWGYGTLAALMPKSRHEARRTFYAARFPAMSFQVGPSSEAVRLLTTPEGRALLGKLVLSDRPSRLSRRVPKAGWAALRGSFNLANAFEGIATFLGPDAPMPAAAMREKFGKKLCTDWSMFEAALDGHAVLAGELLTISPKRAEAQADPDAQHWFAALTVKDEKAADALLASLAKGCPEGQLPKATAIKVGLATVYSSGPVSFARSGDAILFSTSKTAMSIANKLKAAGSLEGSASGKLLDGPVAGALAVDVAGLTELGAQQSGRPLPPAAITELAKYGALMVRLVLDREGALATVEPQDALGRQLKAFVAAVGAVLPPPRQ